MGIDMKSIKEKFLLWLLHKIRKQFAKTEWSMTTMIYKTDESIKIDCSKSKNAVFLYLSVGNKTEIQLGVPISIIKHSFIGKDND